MAGSQANWRVRSVAGAEVGVSGWRCSDQLPLAWVLSLVVNISYMRYMCVGCVWKYKRIHEISTKHPAICRMFRTRREWLKRIGQAV